MHVNRSSSNPETVCKLYNKHVGLRGADLAGLGEYFTLKTVSLKTNDVLKRDYEVTLLCPRIILSFILRPIIKESKIYI